FTATRGMADMDGVAQVEVLDDSGRVRRVMIHVVAAAHLGGPAVAAPIMGDDTIPPLHEIEHLRVPVVGAQRPAVMEHDGLSRAPVLIEYLDAVPGDDRAHCLVSSGRIEKGECLFGRCVGQGSYG